MLGLVTGAARHAIWYVAYQVEGVTRSDPPRDRDDGNGSRDA